MAEIWSPKSSDSAERCRIPVDWCQILAPAEIGFQRLDTKIRATNKL